MSGCGKKADTQPEKPAAKWQDAVPGGELLIRTDLDSDGELDEVYVVKSGDTYAQLKVLSGKDGAPLLELHERDAGSIRGAAVGRAGAPGPILLVSTAGGTGGDLIHGYLYNAEQRKLTALGWETARRRASAR